jgi:hypothetical protein
MILLRLLSIPLIDGISVQTRTVKYERRLWAFRDGARDRNRFSS